MWPLGFLVKLAQSLYLTMDMQSGGGSGRRNSSRSRSGSPTGISHWTTTPKARPPTGAAATQQHPGQYLSWSPNPTIEAVNSERKGANACQVSQSNVSLIGQGPLRGDQSNLTPGLTLPAHVVPAIERDGQWQIQDGNAWITVNTSYYCTLCKAQLELATMSAHINSKKHAARQWAFQDQPQVQEPTLVTRVFGTAEVSPPASLMQGRFVSAGYLQSTAPDMIQEFTYPVPEAGQSSSSSSSAVASSAVVRYVPGPGGSPSLPSVTFHEVGPSMLNIPTPFDMPAPRSLNFPLVHARPEQNISGTHLAAPSMTSTPMIDTLRQVVQEAVSTAVTETVRTLLSGLRSNEPEIVINPKACHPKGRPMVRPPAPRVLPRIP